MIGLARAGSAPLVYYAVARLPAERALAIFAVVCASDLLDGWLARRLHATTSGGAWLDATADFLVVLAAFAALSELGLYPVWLLLLFALTFLQFVLSSGRGRPVYDPVGKYYGAILMVVAGITLALPDLGVADALLFAVVATTIISLLSRALSPPAWPHRRS